MAGYAQTPIISVERRPCLSEGTDRKGIFEWGVPPLLREPELFASLRRVTPALSRRTDNTYGEQLRFKSPLRQNRTLFRNPENKFRVGVPRVRDFALKRE